MVTAVICTIALVLLLHNDSDVDILPEIAFGGALLAFLLSAVFYSDGLDDKKDRLVRELVNDPAALPVVLELRRDLEWVKDPRIQRNAGGCK